MLSLLAYGRCYKLNHAIQINIQSRSENMNLLKMFCLCLLTVVFPPNDVYLQFPGMVCWCRWLVRARGTVVHS